MERSGSELAARPLARGNVTDRGHHGAVPWTRWSTARSRSTGALIEELMRTDLDPTGLRGEGARPQLSATPFDTLTGLPTRVLLFDRVGQALRRCHRTREHLGVLYVELSGLSTIYEEDGVGAGDWVLQTICASLISKLRAEDTVSRIGAEELIAFMTVADPALMPIFESRIHSTLDEIVHLTDRGGRISIRMRSITGGASGSAGDLLREVGVAP